VGRSKWILEHMPLNTEDASARTWCRGARTALRVSGRRFLAGEIGRNEIGPAGR
jgi:hypothetical protein